MTVPPSARCAFTRVVTVRDSPAVVATGAGFVPYTRKHPVSTGSHQMRRATRGRDIG
jgi:hypothetical protein